MIQNILIIIGFILFTIFILPVIIIAGAEFMMRYLDWVADKLGIM